MKTIFFIRHAKAVKNTEIPDAERPLDSRGKEEVAEMIDRLRGKIKPDLIVSSTAVRAIETATAFASGLEVPTNTIMKRQALYHKPEEAWQSICKGLAGKYDSIAIVGHNPSISALASGFAPEFREELPTCGIVGIAFGVTVWKDIENTLGTVVFIEEPGGVSQSKRFRLMKRELGAELTEVIGSSLRMRNPDSADELEEMVCSAAEKIAKKFVKTIKSHEKKTHKGHTCSCHENTSSKERQSTPDHEEDTHSGGNNS